MNNLKELEQKYQELGKEIERLKKSEIQYPIYCLSKKTGLIVKFDGLNAGMVVKQDCKNNVDVYRINWVKHTDTSIWQQLKVCPETGIFDGQLVWCWDNNSTHQRVSRFYDVINRRAFCGQGKRGGSDWNNYEIFEGNYPDWAQQAFKTLQINYEKYN